MGTEDCAQCESIFFPPIPIFWLRFSLLEGITLQPFGNLALLLHSEMQQLHQIPDRDHDGDRDGNLEKLHACGLPIWLNSRQMCPSRLFSLKRVLAFSPFTRWRQTLPCLGCHWHRLRRVLNYFRHFSSIDSIESILGRLSAINSAGIPQEFRI